MITRALTTLGCPYYVIPIEDVQRNALWAAHVMSMTPPFDTCYSSNPLVVRLFREANVAVQSPAMYERERHSGDRDPAPDACRGSMGESRASGCSERD